uniref:Splicing factor 3a subunit 1 n=1 Tax=Loxodonta africana TaxID=9785 RepID=G3TTS0_LOXAF
GPLQLGPCVEGFPPRSRRDGEAFSKEDSTTSKSVVGIIYPPPDIRNILDKTASFVTRRRSEFEARQQKEINNPEFNFLNFYNTYHAYHYKNSANSQRGRIEPSVVVPKVMQLNQKVQAQVIQETIVPKQPFPEFEFTADPGPPTSTFNDMVKLMAWFVAWNGSHFLTQVMQKADADFLHPKHMIFMYFMKLEEHNTKILISPKSLLPKLKRLNSPSEILDQLCYQLQWAKFQQHERKKEEEKEKECVTYAQTHWHDFVVVKTMDFQPHEQGNFPHPTTPAKEVEAQIFIEEHYENFGEHEQVEMEIESHEKEEEQKEKPPSQPKQDIQVKDMDESSNDEEEGLEIPPIPETTMPPPLPPTPDQVIVHKNYESKAQPLPRAPAPDEYLVSPAGEKIPAIKVQKHMCMTLLDPADYSIDQEQNDDEVYAPGLAMESLKHLAEQHTEIFHAEEIAAGKKVSEEEIQKPEEKVTWDGHTSSMAQTQHVAQANITLQENSKAIHKAKALVQEDDTKEKIGPSKPDEIPPPSSATNIPSSVLSITSLPQTTIMPPPIHTTVVSTVPVMPQPLMASVNCLTLCSLIAPMPPIILIPRIKVVTMAPLAPTSWHLAHPMIVPAAFMPAQPVAPAPVPVPPIHLLPPTEKESASKKLKTEDSLQVGASEQKQGYGVHQSPVPQHVGTEWKLSRQVPVFTLPLTDQVFIIKVKICEAMSIPAGKQKLQYKDIFKDSDSLASYRRHYYNMANGAIIHLALKKRGGRRT